ncbi:tetratricopeptide repeat protein [[Eubacterium] cellulosolvens]
MVKSEAVVKSEKPSSTSNLRTTGKKMVVLFAMIIIGIVLIGYKSNYEYWAEQFITYNQILFGVSAILLVLIIIFILMDLKNTIRRELFGSILLAIGGLIIVMFDARSYIGISGVGDDITAFIAIGAILMVVGTIMLMRTGGYVGACLGGIIINIVVAGFYMFDQTSAIQYNSNTALYINLSIVFFILSFLLLGYNDLKFFYLAKLMREENTYRKKKDYKNALNYCNKALKIYPYFATAWNNKGNVLFNMGKKQDAVKCYKKALTFNPNYMPAQKNLQMVKRTGA